MKGRPRPISLKTDVIKSRNRSKGKATSKDRAGAKAKERSESTSRSREEGVVGKKSAPGGDEDDEMTDGRQKPFGDGAFSEADGRKARKTGAPAPYGMVPMPYGAAYPYAYPYPYQPHPHQHQPYPPPRSRSRSSDSSRRAQSLDGRGANDPRRPPPGAPPGAPGSPYYPPPPGYHPGAPGLQEGGYPYPGYPYPAAYGAQPGYPYPPGPHYPGAPHPHAMAHAQALQAPAITHAQSDSRSRSPATTPAGSEAGDHSARSSASPPHPSTSALPPNSTAQPSYYPHPNPNYHLHQPYTHSPLGGVPRAGAPPAGTPSSILRPGFNGAPTNGRTSANGSPSTDAPAGVTLAPMVHFGANGAAPPEGSPRSSHASSTETVHAGADGRVHLPSIGAVAAGQEGAVGRHTGLFEARGGVPGSEIPATIPSASNAGDGRLRGASVSSNSASVSGSSDGGLRSPETASRSIVGGSWAKAGSGAGWSAEDERRGRPERRYDELKAKGKGREFEEIDELDEDEEGGAGHRMVGVETGLGELRVVDPWAAGGSPATAASKIKAEGSSRSRSSGHSREERGRSRGHGAGGRSQSTSRARGLAPSSERSSSSSGRIPLSAEAEITRLKTKVAELTFLNGLMQSRLGQLEGPGRVPHNTMTSLTAETPRPDPDEMYDEQQDAEDEELERYGVSAKDPEMRANLLRFFRQQAGGAMVDGVGESS